MYMQCMILKKSLFQVLGGFIYLVILDQELTFMRDGTIATKTIYEQQML